MYLCYVYLWCDGRKSWLLLLSKLLSFWQSWWCTVVKVTENIGFAWSCEPSDGAHRDEHLYNKIITALDFYLTDPISWVFVFSLQFELSFPEAYTRDLTVASMDVNETSESRFSIFFLDPGKGISRLHGIETSDRPTIGPIVSGTIVTCRSTLAISWSLVCFTAAMTHIPDAQTPQNKGQWRI